MILHSINFDESLPEIYNVVQLSILFYHKNGIVACAAGKIVKTAVLKTAIQAIFCLGDEFFWILYIGRTGLFRNLLYLQDTLYEVK